ncbi:hypothetical protein CHARACLAT_026517 [Characodon lateralis]|uniref:Uncharacterized protein n=1 Tax=Characodon lateralis TaxID=208331 RepID=A0ABU7DVP5_9TELE|nr:hypothetical protein [Characodon lateralis]
MCVRPCHFLCAKCLVLVHVSTGHWSGSCIPDANLRGGASFIPGSLDPATTVTAGLLDLAGTNGVGLAVVGVLGGYLGLRSELRRSTDCIGEDPCLNILR